MYGLGYLINSKFVIRCVCENCGEELISNQLSRGDRETLIHYIQEQMSHDISTGRSAVKEQRIMNAFTEYINKHSERFGTVVDGLNVAYYCIRRREKAFETVRHKILIMSHLL